MRESRDYFKMKNPDYFLFHLETKQPISKVWLLKYLAEKVN